MKLINQSVELITEENPLKVIELAGRVSHKSEDRITEDSYKAFIKQMLKLGHTATLEFGSVYLEIDEYFMTSIYGWTIPESNSMFHKIHNGIREGKEDSSIKYKLYTNLRYILDKCPQLFEDIVNDTLPSWIRHFTPSNNDPYKRYTFKIICNRGVSHELVRHRVFSFLQESTRYCNYSKDKFSNELNIIIPHWMTDFDIIPIDSNDRLAIGTCNEDSIQWERAIGLIQQQYNILIEDCRLKAQDARGILPNDLKTELYMAGFLKDWVGHSVETYAIDIFGESVDVTTRVGFDTLRRHASAHPQAREIADLIYIELIGEIGSTEFAKIKETYYE